MKNRGSSTRIQARRLSPWRQEEQLKLHAVICITDPQELCSRLFTACRLFAFASKTNWAIKTICNLGPTDSF